MEVKKAAKRQGLSPGAIVWRRLSHRLDALFGMAVIALAMVVAVLGATIRPDKTQHANDQQLSLSRKHPGFAIATLQVRKNAVVEKKPFWELLLFGGQPSLYSDVPLSSWSITGDSIVGFTYGGEPGVSGEAFAYHLMDVIYPLAGIATCTDSCTALLVDGTAVTVSKASLQSRAQAQVVTKTFWLGTDKFGRDMLSRLMAGTIVSLSVGLISVAISLLLGISLGAIAGYFGGWIDDFITWLINVVWSVPTLLLVIAITFALGKGFTQVFVAVGLTMWVEVARVVRGQVLALRNLEFVQAATVLGYTDRRIILRHMLPNMAGPIIVISAANFASAILLEAGLSFLGIGAQIPMASWGQMIKEHYVYITSDLAFLALLPGACILLLVLAFTLLGSALRDAFDAQAMQ